MNGHPEFTDGPLWAWWDVGLGQYEMTDAPGPAGTQLYIGSNDFLDPSTWTAAAGTPPGGTVAVV